MSSQLANSPVPVEASVLPYDLHGRQSSMTANPSAPVGRSASLYGPNGRQSSMTANSAAPVEGSTPPYRPHGRHSSQAANSPVYNPHGRPSSPRASSPAPPAPAEGSASYGPYGRQSSVAANTATFVEGPTSPYSPHIRHSSQAANSPVYNPHGRPSSPRASSPAPSAPAEGSASYGPYGRQSSVAANTATFVEGPTSPYSPHTRHSSQAANSPVYNPHGRPSLPRASSPPPPAPAEGSASYGPYGRQSSVAANTATFVEGPTSPYSPHTRHSSQAANSPVYNPHGRPSLPRASSPPPPALAEGSASYGPYGRQSSVAANTATFVEGPTSPYSPHTRHSSQAANSPVYNPHGRPSLPRASSPPPPALAEGSASYGPYGRQSSVAANTATFVEGPTSPYSPHTRHSSQTANSPLYSPQGRQSVQRASSPAPAERSAPYGLHGRQSYVTANSAAPVEEPISSYSPHARHSSQTANSPCYSPQGRQSVQRASSPAPAERSAPYGLHGRQPSVTANSAAPAEEPISPYSPHARHSCQKANSPRYSPQGRQPVQRASSPAPAERPIPYGPHGRQPSVTANSAVPAEGSVSPYRPVGRQLSQAANSPVSEKSPASPYTLRGRASSQAAYSPEYADNSQAMYDSQGRRSSVGAYAVAPTERTLSQHDPATRQSSKAAYVQPAKTPATPYDNHVKEYPAAYRTSNTEANQSTLGSRSSTAAAGTLNQRDFGKRQSSLGAHSQSFPEKSINSKQMAQGYPAVQENTPKNVVPASRTSRTNSKAESLPISGKPGGRKLSKCSKPMSSGKDNVESSSPKGNKHATVRFSLDVQNCIIPKFSMTKVQGASNKMAANQWVAASTAPNGDVKQIDSAKLVSNADLSSPESAAEAAKNAIKQTSKINNTSSDTSARQSMVDASRSQKEFLVDNKSSAVQVMGSKTKMASSGQISKTGTEQRLTRSPSVKLPKVSEEKTTKASDVKTKQRPTPTNAKQHSKRSKAKCKPKTLDDFLIERAYFATSVPVEQENETDESPCHLEFRRPLARDDYALALRRKIKYAWTTPPPEKESDLFLSNPCILENKIAYDIRECILHVMSAAAPHAKLGFQESMHFVEQKDYIRRIEVFLAIVSAPQSGAKNPVFVKQGLCHDAENLYKLYKRKTEGMKRATKEIISEKILTQLCEHGWTAVNALVIMAHQLAQLTRNANPAEFPPDQVEKFLIAFLQGIELAIEDDRILINEALSSWELFDDEYKDVLAADLGNSYDAYSFEE
ncbi:hornerin-like [Watersipora subatra]|uniref:hornerin-like n=1 Tax=Watersipora subatra TaxID=2589382 RepID=UPI00355BD306